VTTPGANDPPCTLPGTAGTRSNLSLPKTSEATPLRSVTWAAAFGSRRDLLVALRDRLWGALQDERTQPRDLSPLTLRLKELQSEIADIDGRDEQEQAPVSDGDFNPEDV